jgi:tRNA-dihydrouridine synthase 3
VDEKEEEVVTADKETPGMIVVDEPEQDPEPMEQEMPAPKVESAERNSVVEVNHAQDDTPDVPFRAGEKKRLHWEGKTCAFYSTYPFVISLT